MDLSGAKPSFTHVGDVIPRPAILHAWERHRHRSVHGFVECVAEFVSVRFSTSSGRNLDDVY